MSPKKQAAAKPAAPKASRTTSRKALPGKSAAASVKLLKKAPKKVPRPEDRYRKVLEEIEEGYWELDLAGNWTFLNEAAAKNLGYAPQELIGTNFRQHTDEASTERLTEEYDRLAQTGLSFRGVEVEFITKQGNRRFTEISGTLIRDKKGRPAGFRDLVRDITERKWAEDALLQSEARYFSIIESIGESYFETDLRGLTTFVNDKVCRDLGYTRNELLRMSHRDLQTAENAQKTYEAFRQIYETGLSRKAYQYEVIRKDGSKAVFEMSISLMHDAEGKPIGFRGLSRDITERRKTEDALKASEERARAIIATIPDPYFENDLRGKVTYVNSAYTSLTGYTLVDLQQNNYSLHLDERNAAVAADLYKTVYKTGLTMKNVEVEATIKGGQKRLVNLSVGLVRNSQGQATGFHGIVRDITERKRAEELILRSEQSLREYSETLEVRVKERTAELEKSKVAAEAASRAKSDFMANISHEFQTPLNAVIGFTKVLQDRMFGELNEKQEEFVHYIAEAGVNLSRIINEILDASQAASGSMKLNVSPVSIVEALAKSTRLLAPQVENKKQILTVDIDLEADVTIEADEQKVQQVLFHLFSNAVKYTADGGQIHVHAGRKRNPVDRDDGISIAIRDNGIGIKAEDIPRLFQTFGTLESPYTKAGKGLGIGLALARQLLELHGGTITVESEYGRGSCFAIFLPLKQKRTKVAE